MTSPEKRQLQLGETLRRLRQSRKLTTAEAAARMGDDSSSFISEISRWEQGEASPSATQLWAYLSAIDSTFADLDRELNPPRISPRLKELTAQIEALAPSDED